MLFCALLVAFLLHTTLARPQALHPLHVCIDEAKTVFTGRAGDIFSQMGRRGDNTPLAMGRRDRHPNSELYRGPLARNP